MEATVKSSITYCDGINKGLNLEKAQTPFIQFCLMEWPPCGGPGGSTDVSVSSHVKQLERKTPALFMYPRP